MKKIIFVLVAILFSDFVEAEDVYNFYFQKTPGTNEVIQNGSGQTVNPPATTVPVAAVTPPSSGRKSHWKFTVGYGHDSDSFADVTGAMINVGYNFNKYFGLNTSYLKKNAVVNSYWIAAGQPSLDKFDIGFHVTPLTLNAFGVDLFEISFLGGMASVHHIEQPVGNGGGVVARDYKPYLGLGFNINFTKNFGLEFFNKFQADDLSSNGEGNPYRFLFSGFSLAWRI